MRKPSKELYTYIYMYEYMNECLYIYTHLHDASVALENELICRYISPQSQRRLQGEMNFVAGG